MDISTAYAALPHRDSDALEPPNTVPGVDNGGPQRSLSMKALLPAPAASVRGLALETEGRWSIRLASKTGETWFWLLSGSQGDDCSTIKSLTGVTNNL